MKYNLRSIRKKDKNFIYNVKKSSIYNYVKKIWGWDEEYQKKDFESDFNLKDFKIIVVNDKDIGFIQIHKTDSNVNITEIHITSKYHGYGIGRDIINNIIDEALAKSKTITIGCFINNIRGKSLYERLGFEVVNKTSTHYEMKYSNECIK
ncbi:GNAT family N-acetyltransferase [Dethiothermospora halolimnae]|uniref:GNAT family N-acetyltransferase n=1 Tax=Dethiothermospora halolimnae TaxID=3114390 RepID=UPI003CCC3FA6